MRGTTFHTEAPIADRPTFGPGPPAARPWSDIMRRPFHLLPLIALGAAAPCYAQHGIRDTSITIVPITLSYAYQVPQGDMALRFGNSNSIALGAGVKFKNNYFIGAEGSMIFGNKVNESGMLSQLIADNGDIVDQDGQPSAVLLYERGWTAMITAAKVMPIVGPNPNSGILLKLGGGYMRHKVRVETQNNTVPALEGDYLKGYDRLTAGPAGLFFVGYQHLGNNRFINFMFGFEVMLGFTHHLRPYNFDNGRTDDGQRVDGLYGLRAGWILPLYRHADDRIYYR